MPPGMKFAGDAVHHSRTTRWRSRSIASSFGLYFGSNARWTTWGSPIPRLAKWAAVLVAGLPTLLITLSQDSWWGWPALCPVVLVLAGWRARLAAGELAEDSLAGAT